MTMKEIYRPSLWFQLFLASVMGIFVYNTFAYAENEEDWMPDSALREVVSEQLGVENFTQADMLRLPNLIAIGRNIVNLKGLEHAKNLGFLDLGGNQISDLHPLAGLTSLE
ncbi:leucine-rich repeat domain-containing protein, partial [Candidatus Poribacteria bacterium]|nr:leucine-rich repeat domain-containing protein [Candidatus Poribacteria bacterium]